MRKPWYFVSYLSSRPWAPIFQLRSCWFVMITCSVSKSKVQLAREVACPNIIQTGSYASFPQAAALRVPYAAVPCAVNLEKHRTSMARELFVFVDGLRKDLVASSNNVEAALHFWSKYPYLLSSRPKPGRNRGWCRTSGTTLIIAAFQLVISCRWPWSVIVWPECGSHL